MYGNEKIKKDVTSTVQTSSKSAKAMGIEFKAVTAIIDGERLEPQKKRARGRQLKVPKDPLDFDGRIHIFGELHIAKNIDYYSGSFIKVIVYNSSDQVITFDSEIIEVASSDECGTFKFVFELLTDDVSRIFIYPYKGGV